MLETSIKSVCARNDSYTQLVPTANVVGPQTHKAIKYTALLLLLLLADILESIFANAGQQPGAGNSTNNIAAALIDSQDMFGNLMSSSSHHHLQPDDSLGGFDHPGDHSSSTRHTFGGGGDVRHPSGRVTSPETTLMALAARQAERDEELAAARARVSEVESELAELEREVSEHL